jgi:hypothetical protein
VRQLHLHVLVRARRARHGWDGRQDGPEGRGDAAVRLKPKLVGRQGGEDLDSGFRVQGSGLRG